MWRRKKSVLTIEWEPIERDGTLCDGNLDTRRNLRTAVEALGPELACVGITVLVNEASPVRASGSAAAALRFGGVRLEEVLPEVRGSWKVCASCSAREGRPCRCWMITAEGIDYEAIPTFLIRRAMLAAAGLMEPLRPAGTRAATRAPRRMSWNWWFKGRWRKRLQSASIPSNGI